VILHELRELARREGLVDDPAFESKPVRWIIVLDEDGSYLGLHDTQQEVPLPEGKKGKPKRQAAMYSIPRRNGRRSNDAADFLVDKSEYVIGIEPEGKRATEDLELRRKLFLKLFVEAAETVQSPILNAAMVFLNDVEARSQCAEELREKKYASNDLLTFRVDGSLLHEDELTKMWWRSREVSDKRLESCSKQCVICGRHRLPVKIHDTLRIAGGAPGGSPLVAFNEKAFEKYGLERNDNAPICRECMTAYVEGLRSLINARYINARTGEPVAPQNVRLTSDTTAVYWANIKDELIDILSDLMYSPQKVHDLLNSPHRGQRSSSTNERFFCLIISGAQGRAMLRSMHTGTLNDLEKNLHYFFDAVRLEGDRGEPKPLGFLLRSVVLQGKLDRLPPRLASEVFLGILFGEKLPRLVLSAAVQRNRAEQKITPERAALLQLFFASHQQKEVPLMSLDAQSTDAPYRLGRLLSAYEQLQRRAQGGNLNRTLVDRYFGAASTRPGTVFPQLVRLSQNHLGKLGPGGGFYQSLITGIVDGIDSFPAMLTLEEQGRFALGYYHQRQFFFRSNKKEENDATEQTTNTSEGENIQ
jgi:CRISPR-associated protein Csd1